MLNIHVEVDSIILHGLDLANALELKVVWLRSVKIYPNNGARSTQPLTILFVALPPGVGDLHGKSKESTGPLLVNEEEALALDDRRRHHNDRWSTSGRERGRVMWVVAIFLATKNASWLWEYNSAKWTFYSAHCCNKIHSQVFMREL